VSSPKIQIVGCNCMKFPQTELPNGVDASFEFVDWCLNGRQAEAHSVEVRQRLFRRPNGRWRVPPLGALLSSASGSADIRLRMVLFLMLAQSYRVGTDGLVLRQADWSKLLGLPLGAQRASSYRRLGTARAALQQQSWTRPGPGGLIQLLDPHTAQPYSPESQVDTSTRLENRRGWVALKSESQARYHPVHWEREPLSIPCVLWANGWVTELSAKSLIAYMILRNHRDPDGLSSVPKIRTHQYAFKADMWPPAIEQLEDKRLLRTHLIGSSGKAKIYDYELIETRLYKSAAGK